MVKKSKQNKQPKAQPKAKKQKQSKSSMPVQQKRPKTAGAGNARMSNYQGLASGFSITNASTIVDHFSRRTEKVANLVTTTGAFTNLLTASGNTGLFINPGNSTLFPIFSQIAANYEMFRLKYLHFEYATESYMGTTTAATSGKVIMVTNYDQSDPAFTDSTSAENYDHMVKGPPFISMRHTVMAKSGPRRGFLPLADYFVNPSANLAAPSGDSSQGKFYDIGLFQLITEGVGAFEIGELYVTYEFDMIRPKNNSLLQSGVLIDHISSSGANATTAAPLGTAIVHSATSTINYTVASTSTIVIPNPGYYMIVASWSTANNNIAALPGIVGGVNITSLNIMNNATSSETVEFLAAGSNSSLIYFINVTASGTAAANTLTFSGNTSMTAGRTDVFIIKIPYGLTLTKEEDKLERRCDLLESQLSELYSTFLTQPKKLGLEDHKESDSQPDVEQLKLQLHELEKRLRDNLFISVRDDTPRIANDTLAENKSRSSSRK